MIVSDVQSFVWRLILGGVLDAAGRGALTPEIDAMVEDILQWMATRGATADAAAESAGGAKVSRDS